jgi:hypothetical protein
MTQQKSRVGSSTTPDGIWAVAQLDNATNEGSVQLNIKRKALMYEHGDCIGVELTPQEAMQLAKDLIESVERDIPDLIAHK